MTESILVIDDERHIRLSLQRILEENGYSVDLAATEAEAFIHLHDKTYHAILLDPVLSGSEGTAIAAHAAGHHPDAAVILLLDHADFDGTTKTYRPASCDYLDKSGHAELILATVSRAVENKRLKAELQRGRMQLKQLADASGEGIIIFRDGIILQVNQQCQELFGLTEETCIGKSMDVLFPNWQAANRTLAKDALARPSSLEFEAIGREGKTFPAEVRLSTLDDPDGASIAIIRDLTASRQEERQRRQMQEKLINAQRMESIGIMAGSVAHDLNNILSSIVTFPELLLLNMPETDAYRNDIKLIHQAGKQAAAVVADLLTVARGSTCKKELCNLNALLKNYTGSIDCRQLRQLYPGISIQLQIETNLPDIEASAIHITKSIINLVTNAAEAIGSNGKITVRTSHRRLERGLEGYEKIPPGRYAVLSVQDTGSGIAEDAMPFLFKPFFSKKEMGRSGTGLGLTVIWNTMRDHQGYIDILSTSNGVRFDLYFPSSRSVRAKAGEAVFPLESLYGRGERILVVDDEESQRRITTSILEQLGYNTFAVANGEKAIEYVQQETVDLLLLDMIMEPGISGHETYRRILQIQPHQRAVVASGYFNSDDQDKIRALGVSRYLTKPFTVASLARAVQEEIRR